jgi:hypothetical protein
MYALPLGGNFIEFGIISDFPPEGAYVRTPPETAFANAYHSLRAF